MTWKKSRISIKRTFYCANINNFSLKEIFVDSDSLKLSFAFLKCFHSSRLSFRHEMQNHAFIQWTVWWFPFLVFYDRSAKCIRRKRKWTRKRSREAKQGSSLAYLRGSLDGWQLQSVTFALSNDPLVAHIALSNAQSVPFDEVELFQCWRDSSKASSSAKLKRFVLPWTLRCLKWNRNYQFLRIHAFECTASLNASQCKRAFPPEHLRLYLRFHRDRKSLPHLKSDIFQRRCF